MTRRARRAACLFAGIAVIGTASSTFAHPRGQRPVIVLARTGAGIDASWVVAADDMQAIGRELALGPITPEAYADHPAYIEYVVEGLTFTPAGEEPCVSTLVGVQEVATGYATTLSADCGGPVDRIRLHTDLLFEISVEYVHLFEAATATTPVRGALSAGARDALLDLAAPAPPSEDDEELGARSRLETFARGEGGLSLVVAIGIALALGAVHGLTPGHGKTLTIAYVAGAHGTLRHAGLLAGVVAVAHGISTFVLALIASGIDKLAPQRITPWLEGVSAILAAIVGIALLRGRHRHHEHRTLDARTAPRLGQLVAIGLIGGLIPGPEAFAVGFTAVAVGAMTRAIVVIVAFSIGLAAVVFGVAAVAVLAGHRIAATDRAEHLARRIGGIVFLAVAAWLAVRAFSAG